MVARRLLLLDSEGLRIVRPDGASFRAEAAFTPDESGLARFASWAGSQRRVLCTMLAELSDEGFQLEHIPYVSGADRKAVINRRLVQHFFGTPYVTALSLGRERDGRRDERMLFAGLTRPAAIDPWLARLRAAHVPLAALYSVPLLMPQLLRVLRLPTPQGMLLTMSHAGIRLSFFDEGRLRFSRLSPAPDGPFAAWAESCARETQKTHQYLSTQRWVARNTRLPVWLLAGRADQAALENSLPAMSGLEFRFLDLADVTRRVGLRELGVGSDSRPLFMRLALREHSANQFASLAERRYFRLWQTRFGISAAGIAAFVACGLLALRNLHEAGELEIETLQTRQAIHADRIAYEALLRSLPELPTSLESLRSTMDQFDRIGRSVGDPGQQVLLPLSRALDQHTEVSLQTLSWQRSEGERDTQRFSGSARFVVEIELSLPVSGEIEPRQVLERIRGFAETLRQSSGGEVSILEQPFDTESSATLRSDSTTPGDKLPFRLRFSSAIREQNP